MKFRGCRAQALLAEMATRLFGGLSAAQPSGGGQFEISIPEEQR
jgi:hypothetical protein